MIRVEKEPCLTEVHIKSAKVIDIIGGFALNIQFNREGTWLFEQYTTSNRGRRFAVLAQWMTPPDKALSKARWLAAPKLSQDRFRWFLQLHARRHSRRGRTPGPGPEQPGQEDRLG